MLPSSQSVIVAKMEAKCPMEMLHADELQHAMSFFSLTEVCLVISASRLCVYGSCLPFGQLFAATVVSRCFRTAIRSQVRNSARLNVPYAPFLTV